MQKMCNSMFIISKINTQKCAKTNFRNFCDIQEIKKWTCPKCMENYTPFYNLSNIELGNLNIPLVIKKVDCTNELFNFMESKINL